MVSAKKGHLSTVEILIELGANIDTTNSRGESALSLSSNETISDMLRAA